MSVLALAVLSAVLSFQAGAPAPPPGDAGAPSPPPGDTPMRGAEITCEIAGGKWPGVWERVVVGADGAVRYEVLSAARVAGPGRAVGRFAAPPDAARAEALDAALDRLPGRSPDAFPPGAVVATLSRGGRVVARWTPADAPALAAALSAAATAAAAHPERTLTMELAPDGPTLVLTAAGAEPVAVDLADPELRLDLRFAEGPRRVLSTDEARAALGGRAEALRVAPGTPVRLPLTLPTGETRGLTAAVLVVRSDVGAAGSVSLATEDAR